MKKWFISLLVIALCLQGNISHVMAITEENYEKQGYTKLDIKDAIKDSIEEQYVYYNVNLEEYDFSSNYVEDFINFSFDSSVMWPIQDKMPVNLDLRMLMETYKKPGLGIDKLHKKGLNGEGVTIAYIDQPLDVNHMEFQDLNLHYTNETVEDNSMHGPAVLSILAGKNVGVAPQAEVYYIANASWKRDQRHHANALHQLVEINSTLPENQKIRMVGFSDTIDSTEKYPEILEEAVAYAEQNGIMVFFCETIDYQIAGIEYGNDINDYTKFKKGSWGDGSLLVPTRRTLASMVGTTNYTYFDDGGASWTTPYVLGLMAIGLQVNPDLTKSELLYYLMESRRDNGAINPEGFVGMIRNDLKIMKRYIYLYNSKSMSHEDKVALNDYIKHIEEKALAIDLVDTNNNGIKEIYSYLVNKPSIYKKRIAGIQILGTANDVPAFDMSYKVKMYDDNIDEMGKFKTDYFYNNLNNRYEYIDKFTVYDWFENNLELEIDLIPQWPVARLPLVKGEYENYFNKYLDYEKNIEETTLVNFSNPIFASSNMIDDFSHFIKYRLDEEFHILEPSSYRIYGNLAGAYPVSTPVLGGYTKDNIAAENDKGIIDFVINSHGQWNNIDQAIFATQDYTSEYRQSFLHISDVNRVLDGNYYNLYLWTCNNADGMNNKNIVHEMMSHGLAVNIIASTAVLSNNGVDNKASHKQMKKGNYYYYYYTFMSQLFNGMSRSDSYFEAEKAYIESFIEQGVYMSIKANPQFAVSNVFVQNYFGLLSEDLADYQINNIKVNTFALPEGDGGDNYNGGNTNNDSSKIIVTDDYGDVTFDRVESNVINEGNEEEVIIKYIELGEKDNYVYFHFVADREIDNPLVLFLAGGAPGLKEFIPVSKNIDLVFKIKKEELLSFEISIVSNFGNRFFVLIPINITRNYASR